MLAGLFRSNQTAVLLAVPVLVLVFFLPVFWHPVAHSPSGMPLTALVNGLVPSTWGQALIAVVVTMIIAVQLALLANGVELMERPAHLPALLFPLILAGSAGRLVLDPALLGMPLVLAAMRRTWSTPNTGPVLGRLFDAGLLIGLAALCHLPYAFMLVVVWAGVSLVRPFAWREYVVPAVGVALIFYLCWVALELSGRTPWRPFLSIPAAPVAAPASSPASKWFLITLVPMLVLALLAFANDHRQSVTRGKNIRSAFMAFVLGCTVIILLPWPLVKGFSPAVLAVPLSMLCSYVLLRPRLSWLAELSVLVLVGLAAWASWG